jgi:hypothetical protein
MILAIRVDKCTDPLKWYAKYVGCYVPLVETTIHPRQRMPEYVSNEESGCVNFVSIEDATIIHVDDDTEFFTEMDQEELSLELFTCLITNQKKLVIQTEDEFLIVNDLTFRKEYVKLLDKNRSSNG